LHFINHGAPSSLKASFESVYGLWTFHSPISLLISSTSFDKF
jgi:hypothetical protein